MLGPWDGDRQSAQVFLASDGRRTPPLVAGAFISLRIRTKSRQVQKIGLITSRPSQNSASVICPPTTNSKWSAARSGVFSRTLLRNRKSSGLPVGAADGVLEAGVEPEGEIACSGRGNPRGAGPGKGLDTAGAPEGFSKTARFRLMIELNSLLKVSRSCVAVGEGAVKVKLWPWSSPTTPSFSRT